MIYTIPTKRGIGIELWGTHDDLLSLYEVIGKFWNNENFSKYKDFENRNVLISGFSFELRKAYEGSKLKRKFSHFSNESILHYGAKFSWVHIIFSLHALRYNMRLIESTKYDLAIFLQLEYWLEISMRNYDLIGAKKMQYFICDGIYGGNKYLYQFMRSINAEFFMLGGGKNAFRKLPDLMNRAILFSDEYNQYMDILDKESKRLNCEISVLELDDDDIEYDKIDW